VVNRLRKPAILDHTLDRAAVDAVSVSNHLFSEMKKGRLRWDERFAAPTFAAVSLGMGGTGGRQQM
jgi:hypothetical protein